MTTATERIEKRKANMTDSVAAAIENNGAVNIVALEGLVDADPIAINAALKRLVETGRAYTFKRARYDGSVYIYWRLT